MVEANFYVRNILKESLFKRLNLFNFTVLGLLNLLIVIDVQASMISVQSESFRVSTATIQFTDSDLEPKVGSLSKRVTVKGFDSTLGNLTSVDITFESTWNLGTSLNANNFNSGAATASIVTTQEQQFEYLKLGENYIFQTAAESDQRSVAGSCMLNSSGCDFLHQTSGMFNGSLDTSIFSLPDFYDSDLEIMVTRKGSVVAQISPISQYSSISALNHTNEWIGNIEIRYTYDPFTSEAPPTVLISDFSGANPLDSWNLSGNGGDDTTVVDSPIEGDDSQLLQMTVADIDDTENPVTSSIEIEVPDEPFNILFEYLFLTETGSLDVLLDDMLLATFNAADQASSDELLMASVFVDNPDLLALESAILSFSLFPGSPAQVVLGDIVLETSTVPSPSTISLFAIGLVFVRFLRRRV